ncbi:ABC transporter ATP-binding protein, partial [Pseudomonas sp. K5002]|nr:ABC transporter ATP-binding protein [Pseudomonas sp. K5002]
MTQRLLHLDHVACRLPDGRSLFDNLNHAFSARATGLVGANGTGKSLLGAMLAGTLQPT